jgi:hypothetical protein
LLELLKERRKVSGSSVSNLSSCFHVSIKHSLNTLNMRSLKISSEWETEMLISDSLYEVWNRAKAIKREHTRMVVRGNNTSDTLDGHHVFIWATILVIMKAIWMCDITIRSSVINSCGYRKLPARL